MLNKDDMCTNFQEWWTEYTKDKPSEIYFVGSTIWSHCFAAWQYSKYLIENQGK